MFLGEFTHSIDNKGRLTIPSRFRGKLAAGLVVTRGFDANLMLYPIDGWIKLAEKIAAQPVSHEKARSLRRQMFALAADLEPDRQGRILLPQNLREFAGINGEAVIVGLYDYVEVWDKDRWQAIRSDDDAESDGDRWAVLGI